MGYAAVVAAARSVAGMENAEAVSTSHLWIDKENVQSDEVRAMVNN